MTLRELLVAHRAVQTDRWDHTAAIAWRVTAAKCQILNQMIEREHHQPPDIHTLNPYRKPQADQPDAGKPALKITGENFHALKHLFLTR